ncbi:MAG: POTRA domain-containing protein, partial [Rhodothermales bacterium]|nr:POTRA domain-containing protein [Rhodothermales bacterium]
MRRTAFRPRPVSGAIFLSILLIQAGAAKAQTTARDTLHVVSDVEIVGNDRFDDSEIKRAISTRASGCKSALLAPFCFLGIGVFRRVERLQPRELRTDVIRLQIFYFRRGYRQATVDTSLAYDDNTVDVTFIVDEGPPVVVRELQLSGFVGILDSARVVRSLPLLRGEPFSEIALTASRESLERRLRNNGYAQAQVLVQATLPASDSLSAFVVLEAKPGPRVRIGEIAVAGNREVDERDVKRLLSFQSGDIYREDEIIRSQRTLYSMALFDYVDISRTSEPRDSLIDIQVQVNEADAKRVQLGFGLTTAECFQVEAGWTHRNFLGSTRTLSLRGNLSNLGTEFLSQRFPCNQAGSETDDEIAQDAFNSPTWQLRADFRQPWFLGTENWLDLSVFGARQSLPDIYVTNTLGGDATLTRQIAA